MSFINLTKKVQVNEISDIISERLLIGMYREFGHGNPRLMDWLETIAADERKYDIEGINENLKGKEEEYVREYLVDIITSLFRVIGYKFI